MHYRSPVADMWSAIERVLDLDPLRASVEFDPDDLLAAIEHCAELVGAVVAPFNRTGDVAGATFEPASGRVTLPEGFADAFARLAAGGWLGLPFPIEAGGGGMPWLAQAVVLELVCGANMSLAMGPLLTVSVVDVLLRQASPELRARYVPALLAGTCTASMCLSEPASGSDLSGVRCVARPHADGTWRLEGTKVFVTWGEHDVTADSIHLVLARTPDGPSGLRGLSCFVVPRLLPDGARNDVRCLGVEHKLGLRASPTCTMNYGEDTGAAAHLLGEVGGGLDVFLPLLGTSRILTGLEGLAQGEQALRAAEAHTADRRQGRAPGATEQSPLADHPDVRRSLRTMSAQVDAMRLLAYTATLAIDISRAHPDPAVRRRQAELLDLLAPVVKIWCTELGVEIASEAVQLHGGLGYMEEAGLAQCLRDVRAAPIYEGANGVLAAELVRRRLLDGDGRNTVQVLVDEIAGELRPRPGEDDLVRSVCAAVTETGREVASAAAWLLERQKADVTGQRDALAGATAFVRLLGTYLGGWMLARQARAAGPADDRLRRSSLVYARRVLPSARSLVVLAQAGADGLFDD